MTSADRTPKDAHVECVYARRIQGRVFWTPVARERQTVVVSAIGWSQPRPYTRTVYGDPAAPTDVIVEAPMGIEHVALEPERALCSLGSEGVQAVELP